MLIASPLVVGRHDQLAWADRALGAVRRQQGQALFLLGEAGIGKSRLASEYAYRAFTEGVAVLRGRSATTDGVPAPFRPIAEALLSLFRVSGPPQDPALAPYRSALAAILPEWRDSGRGAEPCPLVETAEAVLRVLASVAADLSRHHSTGCLLVLEDLHDADAETLGIVEYLCDNIGALPILLVATLRPGAGPAADLSAALSRRRSADLSELRPLSDDEVRQMAEAALSELDPAPQPPHTPALAPDVAERLARDAGGVPFVVEELLSGMVDAGVLRRGPAGAWQIQGDPAIDVPRTVVHSIAQRMARLDPATRTLLNTAAVLGRRFSLPVLKTVTAMQDRDLLIHLRAGIDAQLISPSGPVADSYEFRHALTADALLAALLPTERAAIAGRAADAIERAHPRLAGEWGRQVAGLRLSAGDVRAAALRYAEAGRAALAEGSVDSAVSLLERAQDLLAGPAAAADRAPVVERLVYTLVDAGQLDRALVLADTLPATGAGSLDAAGSAALHSRLAWAAVNDGRHEEAAARLHRVRLLLDRFDSASVLPAVQVVEAHLVLAGSAGTAAGRVAEAERLAREAARAADRAALPEIGCQAWQLLALLERRHGFDRADACLERGLALATGNGLVTWQIRALLRLGANDFMRTGSYELMERAHREAAEHGALGQMHNAEATLAMQKLLCGDFASARALLDGCAPAAVRLGNTDLQRYVQLTRATLAAHQGRRREMNAALDRFRHSGGEESLHVPLVFGCQAVCALLHEDPGQALGALDEAVGWEEHNPSVFYLNGRHGLRLLLRALTGRAGRAEHDTMAADPAASLPWNRHFERLAVAVHEGRAGRAAGARAAWEQAQHAGEPFAMARALGRRLVAEAALADGWGDPVPWLREAEAYFHDAAVPAVASACRTLLRQAGATISQRRTGTDNVPAGLRRQGVTAREYEVFLLLASRMGNQEIAGKLHISARTAEKHVASLLTKTGHPHRTALCDYADATQHLA
jgi:DNA-binding CsgD family transcriptional regulator/tetratricopeptide (TPR) repeat protein